MSALDRGIIGFCLVCAPGLGLYMGRRGSRNMEEFFVSGRELPWWLAGTGMAAAAFSIDTPLNVAGVVALAGWLLLRRQRRLEAVRLARVAETTA